MKKEEDTPMLLTTLSTGDKVYFYKKSLVITFSGKRNVISTAPHNGGQRDDLTSVFNNDAKLGSGTLAEMKAPDYGEHMALLALDLGLDRDHSAGISTAASMENVSIKSVHHKDLVVEALVTGGIDINGGRVGDPASWDELAGESISQGTINIILFINAHLTDGALARSLVTCTEAKTAVLEELMAPSRYSEGLATGSGTDGTIIVSNPESERYFTDAGKHGKLGELIGVVGKDALKEALLLQAGMNAERQHHVLMRTDRFGITNDVLWESYNGKLGRPDFEDVIYRAFTQSKVLVPVSLYVHLLDQIRYSLISEQEALHTGKLLLDAIAPSFEIPEGISMVETLKQALLHVILTNEEN
jgi:adenosylcobinamide amidohydrolase